MRALATLGPAVTEMDPEESGPVDRDSELTETVVRDDLEHATHALRALVSFADEPAAALQCAALRDELDLIRRCVLAAFSMRHGIEGFNRVVFQLAQRDAHSHALALEWLDVTLVGAERAAVALLEPRLSERERLSSLSRSFPLPPLDRRGVLLELVLDGDGRWRRPWITACALDTASGMPELDLDVITRAVDGSTAPMTDEDHIVHETLTGLRNRRLDLV